MFHGQRSTNLFSFALDPRLLTSSEAREVRDILIDINAHRDTDLNARLEDLDLRAGSLIKGVRRIFRNDERVPLANYHVRDNMGELSLEEREEPPISINIDPEMARFSPGALYDMEEKEREDD